MRTHICVPSILLAGCGSWQRPNATAAQFQQDSRQCEAEGPANLPPELRAFGAFPDDSSASRQAYHMYCLKDLGYEWRTNQGG